MDLDVPMSTDKSDGAGRGSAGNGLNIDLCAIVRSILGLSVGCPYTLWLNFLYTSAKSPPGANLVRLMVRGVDFVVVRLISYSLYSPFISFPFSNDAMCLEKAHCNSKRRSVSLEI
jgi:hypothetical protein